MLPRYSIWLGFVLFAIHPAIGITAQSSINDDSTPIKKLDLATIMADSDWMGNSPENPSWSLDGKTIYFQQKANGHRHQNTFKITAQTAPQQVTDKSELLLSASSGAKLNPNKTQGVFVYQGDIYLVELSTQEIIPLTADERNQSDVNFVNQSTISYKVGYQIFLYDLNKKLERQVADFKLTSDPEKEKSQSYLQQSQPRLLDYISKKQQESKFQKTRRLANKQRQSKIWYLGKGVDIKTFRLSPDARWLVLGTVKSDGSGKSDQMPEFVTENGFVKNRKVRPLVGTSSPVKETLYLFDLVKNHKKRLDLSNLPEINDDPLANIRKKAAKKIGYKFKASESARAVYAYDWAENQGVEWSKNSKNAAILLFSYDNKSRWIVSFDTDSMNLKTAHWLTDDAWVNDWAFNQFGWLPDNQTLYYLSEEDGYSHLYIKKGKRKSTQLTQGKFEVSDLTVSKNGKEIFYRSNQTHPGIYEIYSMDLDNRTSRAITQLGGVNRYVLSADNNRLIITHSTTTEKPELFLHDVNGKSKGKQLTFTASKRFKSYPWQSPEVVAIKSSHVDRNIYSRLYLPANGQSVQSKKPAVMFVHGAGYLQNSHQGWSGYFREFMFHNYLTAKGFVVLDMDYRASKGYGRDWRTAIYRNMGTPELQDLKDGVEWLVKNQNVDQDRIGIYGGSYGGFMTFMALFKEPDLFASGAALRPVTDWSHYNHGYTSNILNTPQVDPDAFERSSPIEFADGLKKPLLICHGMVDDNVFFKDSVRLVQKLIELKKTQYFETAIYPVEAHGFKQPSSWLDEYTRIDQLFERTLR